MGLTALTKRGWLGIGIASAALLIGFTCWHATRKVPPPSPANTALVAANVALTSQNHTLAATNDSLAHAASQLATVRDSLAHVASQREAALRLARQTLQPAATVPDSALRPAYAAALQQLDSAWSVIAAKDIVLVQDDSLRALDASRIATLTQINANSLLVIANTQALAADWEAQYKAQYRAAHPLCGRKCGIVLGILGTVGAGLAVHAVVP